MTDIETILSYDGYIPNEVLAAYHKMNITIVEQMLIYEIKKAQKKGKKYFTSQKHIAEMFGLTQARVSQIIKYELKIVERLGKVGERRREYVIKQLKETLSHDLSKPKVILKETLSHDLSKPKLPQDPHLNRPILKDTHTVVEVVQNATPPIQILKNKVIEQGIDKMNKVEQTREELLKYDLENNKDSFLEYYAMALKHMGVEFDKSDKYAIYYADKILKELSIELPALKTITFDYLFKITCRASVNSYFAKKNHNFREVWMREFHKYLTDNHICKYVTKSKDSDRWDKTAKSL